MEMPNLSISTPFLNNLVSLIMLLIGKLIYTLIFVTNQKVKYNSLRLTIANTVFSHEN